MTTRNERTLRLGSLFALVALLPLALAASPAAARGGLRVLICTGDGTTRALALPIPAAPGKTNDDPCCMKGCHAGGNRKKIARQFDPSQ